MMNLLTSSSDENAEIPQKEEQHGQPQATLNHLQMNLSTSSSDENAEIPQKEKQHDQPRAKSTKIELRGHEFWPLSGMPYFDVIISKEHVKPMYLMEVPPKMDPVLPSVKVPTILTYKDKSWDMVYNGDAPYCRKFDRNWKNFVHDNDLKVGDACVFELTECSSNLLKFRVQILRGDLPAEFADQPSSEDPGISSINSSGENADSNYH